MTLRRGSSGGIILDAGKLEVAEGKSEEASPESPNTSSTLTDASSTKEEEDDESLKDLSAKTAVNPDLIIVNSSTKTRIVKFDKNHPLAIPRQETNNSHSHCDCDIENHGDDDLTCHDYRDLIMGKIKSFLNCCGMGRSIRLSSMFVLTLSYFVVEIVVGYLTKSMALVADSFHMLSDVLALIIAFACMKIAKRRTRKNTFGWVRAEILGALVNAVFLLALCFSIFVEAIKRLVEPEAIQDPQLILIVGGFGLFINIIGIFMFHSHGMSHSHGGGGGGHGHSHGGSPHNHKSSSTSLSDDPDIPPTVVSEAHCVVASKIDDSKFRVAAANDDKHAAKPLTAKKPKSSNAAHLNMHGVFLHILGDALGSIIVVVNAVVVLIVQKYNPDSDTALFLTQYLDPSLSLIMVLIICATTLPLLKETALILLQTAPRDIDVHTLKEALLKLPGVQAVHEFHVWRLAGQKVIATAHIRFGELADYLRDAEKIKELFHDYEIHSTTIQPEFIVMRSRNSVTQSRSSRTDDDTQVDDSLEHAPGDNGTSSATGGAGTTSTEPAANNQLLTKRVRTITDEMHGDTDCFVKCPPKTCDPVAKCCGPVSNSTKSSSTADVKSKRTAASKSHISKSAENLEVFSTPPEVRITKPPMAVTESSRLSSEPDA